MSQQPEALGEPPATPVLPHPAAAPVKDKQKKQQRNRGTETMFRVTYQNHVSLSQLADSKANMLININGVIISVLIGLVAPRVSALSWSVAPAIVLVCGCLVSLAFAVIGARPRVTRTPVTVDDVRDGANVLFFAQFTTMPLEDFQRSLRVLMKDRRLLYDHLARQLYEMGQSLDKKYRHLQVAYTAFLLGVAGASVLFVGVLLSGRFGG